MDLIYFLFLQTIKLSLMATIIAVIIFFIKKLLKDRFSPEWHYYIWFLILLRLLIPYSFNSPVSIFNLLDSNNKMQINTANIHTKEENKNINISIKGREDKRLGQSKVYFITQILSIVWIFVVIILIIYVLSVYLSFAIRVRNGAQLKSDNNTTNSTDISNSNNGDKNEKTTSDKTISNITKPTSGNSEKSSSVNSAAKTSSDAKVSTTNKVSEVNKSQTEKTVSNTSSENSGKSQSTTEEYTRQEAANAALNYELQGDLKSSAAETYKGDNYSSFSSGDLGVTVFDSTVIDGKTYYSVRLSSKQMKENGGSGTVDHFYIAKDGSIKR